MSRWELCCICTCLIFLFLDDCLVTFVTQPPQELPCNPYSTAYNSLHLECDVVIVINSSVTLSWYYQSNSSSSIMKMKRRNDRRYRISNFVSFYTGTRYIRSRLTISQVNASDIGNYWCKATLMNNKRPIDVLPCYSTSLKSQSEYSNMTACMKTYLSLPEQACVFPITDCPGQMNGIENDTSSLPSQGSDEENDFSISLWIYLVVSLPIMLFAAITVCTCIVLYCRKTRERKEKQHSIISRDTCQYCGNVCTPASNLHLHVPMLTVQEVQIPQESLSRSNQSLPVHLSVAKQTSTESDYHKAPTRPIHKPPVPHRKNSLPGFAYQHWVNSNLTAIKSTVATIGPSLPHTESTHVSCPRSYIEPIQHNTAQVNQRHSYVNDCPSSLEVYQALSHDTLEEQTLYSQPLSH